ncbi:S41 family peptidase [Massilia sp. CFBP9012]|nr:S41 family peptidase [Massilia sp. CFBP9012]
MLAQAPVMTDPIPAQTARAVVQRTIELVEAEGLYPRNQDEYASAKARLLAALDGAGAEVDRQPLFQHVNAMLGTLDADGHSSIRPPSTGRRVQQGLASARAQGTASSFALVLTAHGVVLHWTPPQSMGDLQTEAPPFLQRFHADYATTPGADKACALVVDLSAQVGGNAWPPFIAMHPLFGQANPAAWVGRDGTRRAFVNPPQLRQMEARHGGRASNPLQRFAGRPLAVVVDQRTSSAGEMLLVALMGEGSRTRTFGQTSSGATTANVAHRMADGSMLALTTSRYAIGDAPVIRGGIAPEVPTKPGESARDTLLHAATWAAQSSPLCRH